MAIGGFLNKAKDSASKAKMNASEKAASLKESGEGKIAEILSDFEAALPFIKNAGYGLTELEVELAISPRLVPHFVHEEKDEADVNQALEALSENSIGRNLLIGLIKAGKLQKKISIANLVFSHVEISIAAMPSVTLQYRVD